ncbi:ribonuclease H-like domain-containing protein [Tanacetum coccineum]|uniref:Ribonuclease H-like domain-containing protein n=1 Tax=Tanacetum coccineum TaxID=301880 RepID=A0ABQ5G472_9ASTR
MDSSPPPHQQPKPPPSPSSPTPCTTMTTSSPPSSPWQPHATFLTISLSHPNVTIPLPFDFGGVTNAQRPQASVSNSRPSNVSRPVNNRNRRPNEGSPLVCENCGFNGHTMDRCFKLIGYPPDYGKRNNSSNTNQNNQNFNRRFISDKGKGVKPIWQTGTIFDSGASQHLTYTDKYLVNTIDISYLGSKVSHPNGTEALITKVARDGKFIVGFDESKCFLMSRDLMDVKIMEIGRQVNGLYYFDNMKAKQTREPFPLSEHKSSVLGELVHLDLWGPYRVPLLQPSSPTIDHYESDLGHSQDSNGSTSESERAATSDHNTTLSEDDIAIDDATEHVHVLNNQPLRRFERASVFSNKYNDYVVDSKQACKDQHWIEAMNNGMDALYRNDTWEICDLPKDRKSIEGIDFDETFSPVVKIVTVRCLINMDVHNNWSLFQLDINNAFLYGELDETVYMDLPEGYYSPDDKRQSKSDYSLFIKSEKRNFLALLVYVDNIIVTGNNVDEIEKFKEFLRTKFQIKDLGKLNEYGLLACKPFATPLEQNLAISNEPTEVDKVLDNVTEYQMLIGKLIYLTHTRPDISYLVHCLIQFMHKPLRSHIKIALKVLRYLKSNPEKGVHIVRQPKASLEAFVDADWAKCLATRNQLLEYRAMACFTSEVTWILKILRDLEWDKVLPVILYCDSQAVIKITANPVFHERTKHLKIDLHFVREIFLSGVIKTQKISTAAQPADIFTKAPDKNQHENLVYKLGLIDVFQVQVKEGC